MRIFRETMHEVNNGYIDLIHAVGAETNLPKGFNVCSSSWLQAEAAIEAAVCDGNVLLTKRLCEDYKTRAGRYFEWGRQNAVK